MLFSHKRAATVENGRRRPVIAGNWKMNKTTAQAVELSQNVLYEVSHEYETVDIVLCPPYIDLKSVSNVIKFDKSDVLLGAQDVFWEEAGAYTGAISALMLAEVDCTYCIVGHSERRTYFGETDEAVNKKVHALLDHEIFPIMCCGEDLDVREQGKTVEWVERQVSAGLADVSAEHMKECIVAYEPIWAIGTGRAATPEQAEEVCAHIRKVLADMAGDEVAAAMRVLYGGSMNPANAAQFMPLEDVDGGLIGGASLDAKDFAELVKVADASLR